jgi:hypothetical protein
VDREDFDAVVAAEETLKSLARSVRDGERPSPQGRLLILDGVIAAIEVLDPAEESFHARIELVRGEWRGLEEVVLYKAFVEVSGPEFFRRIPKRRREAPAENALITDEPALVIGRFTDVTTDRDGTPVPVLEAYYIRNLF